MVYSLALLMKRVVGAFGVAGRIQSILIPGHVMLKAPSDQIHLEPHQAAYLVGEFMRQATSRRIRRPTPTPTCGVNPVTGTQISPVTPWGQTGNTRPSIGGHRWFLANRGGRPRHSGIDISGVLNVTPVVAFLPYNHICRPYAGKRRNSGQY